MQTSSRIRFQIQRELPQSGPEVTIPSRRIIVAPGRMRFAAVSYRGAVEPPRQLRIKRREVLPEKRVIETLVVRPNMRLEAEQILGKYLTGLSGPVRGILAYIDETTIEFLENISKDSSIRLLVSATGGSEKFQNKLRELERGRSIQIVQVTFVENRSERPLFHERWIADGNTLVDIGTDLKSSTIAAKQHTISVYDASAYQDRLANFEWYWKADELDLSAYFGVKVRKKTL